MKLRTWLLVGWDTKRLFRYQNQQVIRGNCRACNRDRDPLEIWGLVDSSHRPSRRRILYVCDQACAETLAMQLLTGRA